MENAMHENVISSPINLAHLTHQVAKAKELLDDVLEDGKRKAERTLKQGVVAVEDCLVDTTYYIKRHPWQSVGVALGLGAGIGLMLGWLTTRTCSKSVKD